MSDDTTTLFPVVEQLIKQYLSIDKIDKATEWLNRFESGPGQMNICAIMIHAEQNGLFAEAITALSECWELDFQFSHPEARANDIIPKTDFLLNKIVADAKLPEIDSLGKKIAELMTGEYNIKTSNSSYRIFARPDVGPRRMVREDDGKELLGQLKSIKLGRTLRFEIIEGDEEGKTWRTSAITEIIPV